MINKTVASKTRVKDEWSILFLISITLHATDDKDRDNSFLILFCH
jgi:hypothetical protein